MASSAQAQSQPGRDRHPARRLRLTTRSSPVPISRHSTTLLASVEYQRSQLQSQLDDATKGAGSGPPVGVKADRQP